MKSRVRNGKFVFEYEVGSSSFGSIAVFKDREAGLLRTCKTVPLSSLKNPAEALFRLKQLQTLKHPHVAGVIEVIEEPTSLFIVSEFAGGGDIDDWVQEVQRQEHNTCIDEATCCGYTRQALMALAHCEQQGIVHGDLRPSNLLLTTKNSDAAVKVDGFGLTSILDPDRSSLRQNISPYTAPEVADGASAYFNSGAPDVWSLGAIAHALLVGYAPSQKPEGLLAGLFSARGDDWADRSAMSRDFVQLLLRPAGERPTAVKALQHPWIKALVPSGPSAPLEDVSSKTLCYMLSVLLVPALLPIGDFEKLQWSFLQADTDGDGLVPRHVLQRLLQNRSLTKEVAQAAIEISDTGAVGVLDMCTAAVADIIGREFMASGPASATEVSQRLMKRFFEIYSDTNSSTITSAQIRNRLRTATRREMERCCGVNYDQVLSSFPEQCPLTAQVLAASFINCGGQGTPICGTFGQDSDELSQFIFGLDGLENVIGGIFKACGLKGLAARRITSAECI